MLKRLSITGQFTLLGGIGVIITLIAVTLGLSAIYDVALQSKKTQIRNLVDSAVTMTEFFVHEAQAGHLSTAQAQQLAKGALSDARFDNGNYFFVNTYDGVTIVLPNKKLVGVNRMYVKDAYGTIINKPMIDSARAGHPAFVSYYFPKAGQTTPEPKIGYSVAVPEWQWTIGSGVYVDDVRKLVIRNLEQLSLVIVPLFIVFLAVIYFLRRGVARLLAGLTHSMEAVATGHFDTNIPGADRRDELGRMAVTLGVFRDASLEKEKLERETEAARAVTAQERANAESERADRAQQQTLVVSSLASGLERLSEGDLVFRLAEPFTSDYEKLRHDFNAAMDKLQETMSSITSATSGVRSGAGEIAQASDDLSRRTEQQAAGLEETAAALDEITMAVRKTAEGAQEARSLVSHAKSDAEQSGKIVHDAISAMGGIEESSRQIGNIVSLIDEIAFQTNLLALNAGVEAARAGEAGRGFAVVAAEVKSLSSQTAEATKEIGERISQIQGATREAVDAIQAITTTIEEVSVIATAIGSAIEEQGAATAEIARNVTQTAAATRDVTTNIGGVSAAANETGSAAGMLLSAASDLSKQAEQLSGEVNTFLAGVRAA
ncbi:MAG TPA: methyl-accepting chemotaxis protein [Acidisoma sp.]|uniref:methyl-accepting chemotaxis protein n=1 Tax=Acidisoma sp. TaxID=1872115 RepID=UPI002B9F6269|nr:methyl-accepting chemotaxis protein [Acidisoma sp.]HTI03127.1 methyl-accepting chemotaxis protein [Acidisoma sp.]